MSILDGVLETIKKREGGMDKFLDDLYHKMTKDDSLIIVDTTKPVKKKQLTIDDLIEQLEVLRIVEGGNTVVYMEDSSGYDNEVTGIVVDHKSIVLH